MAEKSSLLTACREGLRKQASRAAVGAALVAVCASHQTAPLRRAECEALLGQAMSDLAEAEGQRRRLPGEPATVAGQADGEAVAVEIIEAFRAGMTVAEIAFCLDVSERFVSWAVGLRSEADADRRRRPALAAE